MRKPRFLWGYVDSLIKEFRKRLGRSLRTIFLEFKRKITGRLAGNPGRGEKIEIMQHLLRVEKQCYPECHGKRA